MAVAKLWRIVATLLALVALVIVFPDRNVSLGPALAISNADCAQTVGAGLTASATASGSYCIISFTSGSGTWTIPTGVKSFDVLVVGGGGGGGSDAGGGGGGGGIYLGSVNLGADSSRSASIAVGSGGLPKKWSGGADAAGSNGGSSSLTYTDGSNQTLVITSGGGGVGSSSDATTTAAAGSGGAVPVVSDNSSTASATPTISTAGGAGGAGVTNGYNNTNTSTNGAKSGTGGRSNISVFAGDFGGGGGGGATTVDGQSNLGGGGVNGGGNGAGGRGSILGATVPSNDYVSWFANAGVANSGGGGGAGAAHGQTVSYSNGTETYISRDGKPGGSGVVKVRYSYYVVSYNYNSADGGNATTSANSIGGSAITLPTPTRTGFAFGGWYSDSGLTTSIGAAGSSYTPSDNMTAYAKWTETTAPTVSTFSPADDALGVAVGANLVLSFSESVSAVSGKYVRICTDKNTCTGSTVSGDVALVYEATNGVVTGGGTSTITINPASDLTAGTTYYVSIDSGAFKDTANNDYTGLTAGATWNFRTAASSSCSPTKSNPNGAGTFPVQYRFTASGVCNWSIPSGVTKLNAVIVGGGGGGAFGNIGGGGGAGLVRETSEPLSVTAGESVEVGVGAGGSGGWTTTNTTWRFGYDGHSSSFASYLAEGGGGGGGGQAVTRADGAPGGSGGGGSRSAVGLGGSSSAVPESGWTKKGFAGGAGEAGSNPGGGGGGAGGVGQSSNEGGNGGTGVTVWGYNLGGGGDGWPSSTSNTSNETFGGGAGNSTTAASGTKATNCPACQGDANTGGGGGGGGDGGNGVVMVRFGAEPTIGTQPSNQTAASGSTAAFSVTASATYGETLTYQWQKAESTNTSSWSNITSATTATYTTGTLTAAADSGDLYRVVVTTTLDGASASATSSSASVTVPSVPGIPAAGPTVTAGNAQASLSWTAPASNGGSAITDYVIEYSSDAGSTWTTFSDGTSTLTTATVTGLTNGIAYQFRVSASNVVGTGSATSASSANTMMGVATACAQTAGTGDPYQIDAGGSPASQVCSKAFDNDTSTKFINWGGATQNNGSNGVGGNGGVKTSLLIDLKTAWAITKVGLTTANDYSNRDPTGIELYGSNTSFSSGMTLVGSATGLSPPGELCNSSCTGRNTDYSDVTIGSPAAYRYYKLKFTSIRSESPDPLVALSEIRLYGNTNVTSLTVTYDSQGGSAVSNGTTLANSSIGASPGSPTKAGSTFAGWFVASSGGSAITFPYSHGQSSNFTLYAQWTTSSQTITYAAGTGGSGSAPVSPTSVLYGSTFTTPANTYTRAGHSFAGWSDGTRTYAAGATYPVSGTVSGNVALTATWTDSEAPTVSLTTARIRNSQSATVQSTETGTAYLVSTSVSVTNKTSITGAADSAWNQVSIAAANTATSISGAGLADGTYKAYAVDALDNLSVASSNTVTIDSTAPTVTLAATAATATSASISFTVTGSEDIECATLSTTSGIDFALTGISSISSIVQTSGSVCTVNVTSSATAGGGAVTSILAAAGSFGVADTAGNSQSTLSASPQSTVVTIAAFGGGGGGGTSTTSTSTTTTSSTTTTLATTTSTTTPTTIAVVATTSFRPRVTTTSVRRTTLTSSTSTTVRSATTSSTRQTSTTAALRTTSTTTTLRPSSTTSSFGTIPRPVLSSTTTRPVTASVVTTTTRPVVTSQSATPIRPTVTTLSTTQSPTTSVTLRLAVQANVTTSSVASSTQDTSLANDSASVVATSLPLSQQVSSDEVRKAIEARESNLNDLSVPVYVNSELPQAEPENPIVIQTGEQTQLDIITVNEQIVQVQDAQGFRVSVGSLRNDGTFAEVNSRGALLVLPGGVISFSGEGFEPYSEAVAWLFSDPRRLGVMNVDENGRFDAQLTVTAEVPIGAHTTQVNGLTANGQTRSLNLAVEVVEGDNLVGSDKTVSIPESSQGPAALSSNPRDTAQTYSPQNDPVTSRELAIATTALLSLAAAGAAAERRENRRGKLASVVTKKLKATKVSEEGRGDRSGSWRGFGTAAFDKSMAQAPLRVGPFSALFSRVFVDGAWLRAILGVRAAGVWSIGAVLAAIWSFQTSGFVNVPTTWVLCAVLVVAAFDAMAGLVAALIITTAAVGFDRIDVVADVRTLLGIWVLLISSPLLAHVIRPLRRTRGDENFVRERFYDYAMMPVFVAFAAGSMVKALNGLSGLDLVASSSITAVKWAVWAAMILRLAGEDIALTLYPKRTLQVQPAKLVSQTRGWGLVSAAIRFGVFLFVAYPFFGINIGTVVAALLTAGPALIKLWEDDLPNSERLFYWLPRGFLRFFLLLILGGWLGSWLVGEDATPDVVRGATPWLLVPGAIFGIVELFGRSGKPWRDDGLKHIGGAIFWLIAVLIVAGRLQLF